MASQLVWHIRAQRNTWINPCEKWASLLMQQIDKIEFEHAIQPSESLSADATDFRRRAQYNTLNNLP